MTAAVEGAQAAESLALDLWAPDQGIFAAVRGHAGQLAATLLLDGVAATAGSAELIESAARVETHAGALEVALGEKSQAVTTAASGIRRAARLVEVAGKVTQGGRSTDVGGHGVLARTSAEQPDAARQRSVVAATDDGALLQIIALRPAADTTHGDEVVSAQVAEAEGGDTPHDFEEVRLSTIYRPDGSPRIAGAELYRPGDEFPARLSGEAVSAGVVALDGRRTAVSFFRWTYVGRPGWGSYEIEPAP